MKQKKKILAISQLFLVGIISFQGLASLNGLDFVLNNDYLMKNKNVELKLANYQNIESIKDIYNLKLVQKEEMAEESGEEVASSKPDDYFYAVASWYGPGFHGRKMANGQVFNMYDENVVAHKSLPFGTKIEIINPKNDLVLYAVVKDRGPYIKGRDFDLSYAGAEKLGMVDKGVEKLKVRIIE